MHRPLLRAALATAAIALPLAACSKKETSTESGSGAPEQSSTTAAPINQGVSVELRNKQFQPQDITVKAGQTVTWKNDDAFPHTVTEGTPSGGGSEGETSTTPGSDAPAERLFASEKLKTDDTFVFTFSKPGTYPYYCSIHLGSMTGTITVEG